MKIKRNSYREAIKQGVISPNRNFNELIEVLKKHLKLEPLPEELIKNSELGPKITSSLTCLPLYVAKGHKSWSGLVIGFPGTKEQLSTESVKIICRNSRDRNSPGIFGWNRRRVCD